MRAKHGWKECKLDGVMYNGVPLADVQELLRESMSQDGVIKPIADDEVERRMTLLIDLMCERIAFHRETAGDLRQQAVNEELLAEQLLSTLNAVGSRITLAGR
jgi:hypothetical protein